MHLSTPVSVSPGRVSVRGLGVILQFLGVRWGMPCGCTSVGAGSGAFNALAVTASGSWRLVVSCVRIGWSLRGCGRQGLAGTLNRSRLGSFFRRLETRSLRSWLLCSIRLLVLVFTYGAFLAMSGICLLVVWRGLVCSFAWIRISKIFPVILMPRQKEFNPYHLIKNYDEFSVFIFIFYTVKMLQESSPEATFY